MRRNNGRIHLRAQNPGRSQGKQKNVGFTVVPVAAAGRPWAQRTSALPQGCSAPVSTGSPAKQSPLCRLLPLSHPCRCHPLTHLCLGVTEGTFTFSLFHPLKIFIPNKGIPFPACFNHHCCLERFDGTNPDSGAEVERPQCFHLSSLCKGD